MKYVEIKSPIWSEDGLAVDCIVVLDTGEEIPFTASPTDPTPHAMQIRAEVIAGKWGEIADPLLPTPEQLREQASADALASRKAAYRDRSDPLFMEAQFDGMNPEALKRWHDEVAAIKREFPFPE